MVSEVEKAYAAGFFDGEGSVSIAKPRSRRGYAVQLAIGQKDSRPLTWLQSIWGGSIRSFGSNAFLWETSSAGAGRFLTDIFPYLKVKQEVAALALEMQATKNHALRATPEYLTVCETIRLKVINLNALS